jgi:uncharacterized protein
MDVTPLIRRDTKIIQSYRGGTFKISGSVYPMPVIVMADQVIPWPEGIQELILESFAKLEPFIGKVETILLGTGNQQERLSLPLKQAIKQRLNMAIEPMDTGAACRTYNVLVAEGRPIAALLKPFNY